MTTETDGRSASAPLAAPTTSALPHTTHSSDAIDTTIPTGGIAFATIPTGAVPSFFANPFMTPFMPQQAAASSVVPQESGADAAGDYRSNPLPSDAYYLQSVQYQEMMQQYIQTLMAAASTLPTASTADLSQQTRDGGAEADGEHTEATERMLRQQLAAVPSASGLSSYSDETSCSNAQTTPLTHQLEDISLSAEQPTAAQNGFDEDDASVAKNASSTASVDEQGISAQQSHLSSSNQQGKDDCSAIANGVSSCSEEKEESMAEHTEACSSHEPATKAHDSEGTQPVACVSDVDGGAVTKGRSLQDNSNSTKDCRTSVLIKKQMNEIDKEINRRIQNKNIKKAALPFGAADVQQDTAGGGPAQMRPSLNQLKTSYGLSQLPSASLPQQQQQAIYQNHFPQQNPSVCAMVKAAVAQQPNQPKPMPFGATVPQSTTFTQSPATTHFPPYFPTAQPMFFPGTQQPVTPQLAAALLQQFQQGQQMGLFPMAPFAFGDAQQQQQQAQQQTQQPVNSTSASHMSHVPHTVHTMPAPLGTVNTAGLSIASAGAPSAATVTEHTIPPPPSASGPCLLASNQQPHAPLSNPVSSSSSSQLGEEQQWPDENGWNEIGKRHAASAEQTAKTDTGDEAEPVWVMRDSYLKRIQREEDRNHETVEAHKNVEKNSENAREEVLEETDRLLAKSEQVDDEQRAKKASKKEVMVHEPAVLIEGVLFRARYLGSTQLICEGRPTKSSRMMQAQEAVARVKAPAGEIQPSTDIDLFISTEKIMVLNTDLQDILMDHALRTISYIADIGDLVVLMARRMSQSASEEECSSDSLDGARRAPRVICHVFESEEASFIAQSIGQAFQVAYVEFLRANGIDDPSYLREIDYQEVLNSQEMMGEELEMFARKETQKDVVVPKKAGEPLGVVVVESGWGSMLPTVVIANLQPAGAASRCNQLNIGDQIIAINGISLVGLPLAAAQQNIKGARSSTAVKLTVVSTPPVVEVRIKRPDTKYQLGFSVQNGVICSLLRGGIAERGGIRVGHRIIEINSQSVVAVAHEKIVNMLATAIGDIHMKTMPTSMFRLLTGQEVPNYI